MKHKLYRRPWVRCDEANLYKGKGIRSNRGIAIAEASSCMALLIPLTFLVVLAAVECSAAYIIHMNLTQAAQRAANDLGVVWAAQNQPNQPLTAAQQKAVFDTIVVPRIIPFHTGDNNNFKAAVFNFNDETPSVTVTAVFVPGGDNLKFPGAYLASSFLSFSIPNLLTLQSSVTYPLPNRTNGLAAN